LSHIAEHTAAQDDLRGRIIGAVVYPVLLLVFLIVVVTGIMVFIVPNFTVLFDSLRSRGELPQMTEWLLFLSDRTKYILAVVAMIIFAGTVWYRSWGVTDRGRLFLDGLKLRFPVAGKVYEGFAISRFCHVLGTLLKNGVPIVKSLEIAGDAIGNRVLLNAIQRASEKISSGARLAVPLAESGCFPVSLTEMIAIAEESNTLDSVLISASAALERRNWRALDLAVRFIEPIMLILLGVIVLFLVMALILPVFNMAKF
jgi:general secretion pathway protein F/type IV pilus assembly protein PilC